MADTDTPSTCDPEMAASLTPAVRPRTDRRGDAIERIRQHVGADQPDEIVVSIHDDHYDEIWADHRTPRPPTRTNTRYSVTLAGHDHADFIQQVRQHVQTEYASERTLLDTDADTYNPAETRVNVQKSKDYYKNELTRVKVDLSPLGEPASGPAPRPKRTVEPKPDNWSYIQECPNDDCLGHWYDKGNYGSCGPKYECSSCRDFFVRDVL